jgi:hypothetical protein
MQFSHWNIFSSDILNIWHQLLHRKPRISKIPLPNPFLYHDIISQLNPICIFVIYLLIGM